MFTLIFAIILFTLTIPLKTTKLAIATADRLKKRKDKEDGKEKPKKKRKTPKSVVKLKAKLGIKEDESDKTKFQKLRDRLQKVKKVAIKTVKYIILILQIISGLLASLGVLNMLLSLYLVFALVGAVYYVAVGMNGSSGSFNFGSTTTTTPSGNSPSVNTQGNPVASAETMANWYIDHMDTYQNDYHHKDKCSGESRGHAYYNSNKGDSSKMKAGDGGLLYYCELTNTWVRDDCTGYAAAYATLVSGEEVAKAQSSSMVSSWDATNHGWTKIDASSISSVDELKPGDILVTSGHAEIFISASQSWGWGGIQSIYPKDKTWSLRDGAVRLQYDYGDRPYKTIYRYTGK